VVDFVDLHFIEDIDGVAVGGVGGGFEDDLEPGGVGAAFLVEEDAADGGLIDGFACCGIEAFVVVDAVVFSEEEGECSGFGLMLTWTAVIGKDEAHGGGFR